MAKNSKPQPASQPAAPPPAIEARAIAICAAHGNRPDELLEIMHDIQHEIGHVPESTLPVLSLIHISEPTRPY